MTRKKNKKTKKRSGARSNMFKKGEKVLYKNGNSYDEVTIINIDGQSLAEGGDPEIIIKFADGSERSTMGTKLWKVRSVEKELEKEKNRNRILRNQNDLFQSRAEKFKQQVEDRRRRVRENKKLEKASNLLA